MSDQPDLYVCRHESPPTIVRAGYQCSEGGDEPVYPGDTITTVTTTTQTTMIPGRPYWVAETTITVTRP